MQKDKIDMLLMQKGKHLPQSKIGYISKLLEHANEHKSYKVMSVNTLNPTLFTVMYWLLPFMWLIDRFFTGQYLTGFIKCMYVLLLFLFLRKLEAIEFPINFGGEKLNLVIVAIVFYPIWIIVDGFTISYRIKRRNYYKIHSKL